MALWLIFLALVILIGLQVMPWNALDPEALGQRLERMIELLEANQKELMKIRKHATGERDDEDEEDPILKLAEEFAEDEAERRRKQER